jgi:hypothetical protein
LYCIDFTTTSDNTISYSTVTDSQFTEYYDPSITTGDETQISPADTDIDAYTTSGLNDFAIYNVDTRSIITAPSLNWWQGDVQTYEESTLPPTDESITDYTTVSWISTTDVDNLYPDYGM